MIKAVAQAIPTYVMSCFDLKKSFCDQLSTLIGRFCWSQQDKENKIHWISWERLTRSKKKRGPGFKDLHIFNMVMLARQAWRMLTCPDSLCATILRAKYHPKGDILHAAPKPGVSCTRRSILRGAALLREGVVWLLGDGTSINLWNDPWIPRESTRQPITVRGQIVVNKVSDLSDPNTGTWDEVLINDIFCEEDVEHIKSIPVCEHMEDSLTWHPDPKGIFTVKSEYKLGIMLRDAKMCRDATSSGNLNLGQGKPYHFTSYGTLPNKLKMFLWRLAHNSLPLRSNVRRSGVDVDTLCPVCRRMDENGAHSFSCKAAKDCWRRLQMEDIRLKLMECPSVIEVFFVVWKLDHEIQQQVLVLLWQ